MAADDDFEQRLARLSYNQLVGYLQRLGIYLPRGVQLSKDEVIYLIVKELNKEVSDDA